METTSPPRRGRPPLDWIDAASAAAVAPGTVLVLDVAGQHRRTTGRVVDVVAGVMRLATGLGPAEVAVAAIARARVVEALYAAGDPVVRVGVDASAWRGGVVRTSGTDVLVEQIGGDFAWVAEGDLEAAEARDAALPALPRGPVPARTR